MDNKTLSIVSYITPIGWLIAFLVDREKTDALRRYHLKQSLGLILISFLFNIVIGTVAYLIPLISFILSLLAIAVLVLLIIGILNAANGQMKPVPVVGKYFENTFSFLD